MTIITVNAERSYEVTLTNSWREDLASICEARTRVAVIVSETYSPELTEIMSFDSELHVFQVPDGEDGKSISTLTKVWNWLGANSRILGSAINPHLMTSAIPAEKSRSDNVFKKSASMITDIGE